MQDPFRRYQSWDEVPEKKAKSRSKAKKNGTVSKKVRKKVKRKTQSSAVLSKKMTYAVVLCSLLGLGASVTLFLNPKLDISKLVSFRVSLAKSFAQSDKGGEKPAEEINKNKSSQSGLLDSEHAKLSMENTSLHAALEKKRLDLEKRERSLDKLAENLEQKKLEIDKQLKEVASLRREISSVLDEKVVVNKKSLDNLVSVYSNMKPGNAARILSSLNEDLAVKVLGKMKKQNAAAILNYIEPKKAQVLSEKYAGLETEASKN